MEMDDFLKMKALENNEASIFDPNEADKEEKSEIPTLLDGMSGIPTDQIAHLGSGA